MLSVREQGVLKQGYNLAMLQMPTADPEWIATSESLERMVSKIAKEPKLAVDTESNSLFAYHEKVCLIQISTPTIDYLIDPLAIKDLSILAPMFSNSNQQKIFHAAEYDFICLKRGYGFAFSNIFDTMVAGRILSEPQVGLGPLLSTKFEITLDKRYQRANWGTRPLSKVMLDYARMDTHFLFALQTLFEEQLKQANLWELAQEDFALSCDVQIQPSSTNSQNCWKVSGATRINPREAAILQELCTYRDQQAQKLDLPHFKVLSNDLLLELSQTPPQSLEELKNFPGFSERLFKRHANGIMRAIDAGEHSKPVTRQPRVRPDDQFLKRLDLLRNWRKALAKEMKVESDIILPRDIMEKIAAHDPANEPEMQNVMSKTPWRYRQYGISILKALGRVENNENNV